jgi:hypothetical protein
MRATITRALKGVERVITASSSVEKARKRGGTCHEEPG